MVSVYLPVLFCIKRSIKAKLQCVPPRRARLWLRRGGCTATGGFRPNRRGGYSLTVCIATTAIVEPVVAYDSLALVQKYKSPRELGNCRTRPSQLMCSRTTHCCRFDDSHSHTLVKHNYSITNYYYMKYASVCKTSILLHVFW